MQCYPNPWQVFVMNDIRKPVDRQRIAELVGSVYDSSWSDDSDAATSDDSERI